MVTSRVVSGDGQTISVGTAAAEPFRVELVDDAGQPVVGRRYKFVIKAQIGKRDLADACTNDQGEAQMYFTPDAAGPFKVFLFAEGEKAPLAIFAGNGIEGEFIHVDGDVPDMPEPSMKKPLATPPPLPFDAEGPAAEFFAKVATDPEQVQPENVLSFPVIKPPPPAPRFEVSYGLLIGIIAMGSLAAAIAALLT